jgi:hypothetical protein
MTVFDGGKTVIEGVHVAPKNSEKGLIRRIAEESVHEFPDPFGACGNPFGYTHGQTPEGNVFAYNSGTLGAILGELEGQADTSGEYVAAQLFYNPQNMAQRGANVVDMVLATFPETPQFGARFILQKVAGAYAFKIGVAEARVEEAIVSNTSLKPVPRSLEEVALDERNKVDLRLSKAPDYKASADVCIQVKTDSDKNHTPKKEADYVASWDTEEGVVRVSD